MQEAIVYTNISLVGILLVLLLYYIIQLMQGL